MDAVGLSGVSSNPGPVAGVEALQPLISRAVDAARDEMALTFQASEQAVRARVQDWSQRVAQWSKEADALVQRSTIKQQRVSVQEEQALAAAMAPDRQLVRPLVVVLPADHPVADARKDIS